MDRTAHGTTESTRYGAIPSVYHEDRRGGEGKLGAGEPGGALVVEGRKQGWFRLVFRRQKTRSEGNANCD